jgi:thioredoxin 2
LSGYLSLVCPDCDAVNRLPQRTAKDARCDQCGAPIFPGRSIALSDPIRIQKHVVSNDIPTLVLFGAPWCGPCRLTMPEMDEAAPVVEPDCRLVTVDTDQVPELRVRYAISAIPTLILFSHGQELARRAGSIKAAAIARFVSEHSAAPKQEQPRAPDPETGYPEPEASSNRTAPVLPPQTRTPRRSSFSRR